MTKTEMALVIKNPPANAGDIRDVGLIPGSGRSLEGGHSNPLQYSCLENPMDRGAWWATVHGVTKSQTRLSDYHFHFLMTNLDSILKSITLLTKVCTVKSYGFFSSHVWMWELDHKEDWELKSWCFWTVVLEKTLESLSDCKEIKPVNPKEVNPEYSLEGLMLKLKLQYFGHWVQRVNSLEKTLMLGNIESKR